MKIEEGQVAVVTGAASGIGYAVARALVARGVRVVMADIDEPVLQRSVDEIGLADYAIGRRCDVARLEDVEALRTAALETYGRVDMVMNDAGVTLPFAPMWERTAQDWEWLMGINLWGVIHGIRTFTPGFVEQGSGHVINTASMAGVTVMPFNNLYAAAKHAVVSLTENLAGELAQRVPGVYATVVCPGLVPTRLTTQADGKVGNDDVPPALRAFTIDVELAAQRIIAGIEANKTYVFTNPGARDRISGRFEALIADCEDWN